MTRIHPRFFTPKTMHLAWLFPREQAARTLAQYDYFKQAIYQRKHRAKAERLQRIRSLILHAIAILNPTLP